MTPREKKQAMLTVAVTVSVMSLIFVAAYENKHNHDSVFGSSPFLLGWEHRELRGLEHDPVNRSAIKTGDPCTDPSGVCGAPMPVEGAIDLGGSVLVCNESAAPSTLMIGGTRTFVAPYSGVQLEYGGSEPPPITWNGGNIHFYPGKKVANFAPGACRGGT